MEPQWSSECRTLVSRFVDSILRCMGMWVNGPFQFLIRWDTKWLIMCDRFPVIDGNWRLYSSSILTVSPTELGDFGQCLEGFGNQWELAEKILPRQVSYREAQRIVPTSSQGSRKASLSSRSQAHFGGLSWYPARNWCLFPIDMLPWRDAILHRNTLQSHIEIPRLFTYISFSANF